MQCKGRFVSLFLIQWDKQDKEHARQHGLQQERLYTLLKVRADYRIIE